jgi:ABC-type ATPase involved in cell division
LYKAIRKYRWTIGKVEEDKELIKNAKVAADKVFLLAMKDAEPKVSKWKIYCAWKAVDLFGRWSIIPNEDNI